MSDIQILIVGGGIVGLSIAEALLKRERNLEVAIIEKEQYLGDHTSGRNSGVIHAGIYYSYGSLKQKFCVTGNEIWKKWARENAFPLLNCGKFIVTTQSNQIEEIESTYLQAQKNGAKNLRWATAQEMEILSQYTFAKKAFFSPSTSITDVSGVIKTLSGIVEQLGAIIVKKTNVNSIRKNANGFQLQLNNDKVTAKILVNAAGLGAVTLRRMLGLDSLEDYFVKGHYLKSTQEYYTESLIYPLPEKNLKGLGIHTTFDFNKNLKFGPDTHEVQEIKYNMPENLIGEFIPAIQQTFKNIDSSKLSLDYAGIRPKIKLNGELYNDFWVKFPDDHHIKNYFELCGIESPGLTASPVLGAIIAKHIITHLT